MTIFRKINEIKGEYLNIIPLILRSWSIPGRELFVPNFMEKLKKSAEPIIVAASKF